jgi:SnoaL-like protein
MRTPKIVLIALIASVPLAFVATQAQKTNEGSHKVATLTAQDYLDIQQLVNRYAFAIDTCSNNGYDYADLYTPDGVFYWGVGARKSVGREELAEAAGGGKLGCQKLARATAEKPIATHVTVNLVIEPSPEGATGKSYLVYPGVRGIDADPDHSGHVGGYQDVYVKTAQGWRFKSRLHVFPPRIPGTVDIAEVEKQARPHQ